MKIKVGRKLKRQNETVVDLMTKKIKLPKERETEKDAFDKSPRDIIDEAIASLDLEKSSIQLQAIQSLNRILDPFVRQTATIVSCGSFGQTLSSADKLNQCAAIFRNIFHPQSQQADLNVQLGTLLSAVHRLCRAAQDSRLGPALIKLSENLIKLLSTHPKFVGLLSALDVCAIALLQRPESPWLWVGCELSDLVLQAHNRFVSLCSLRPDLLALNVFDASEQLVRSSVYSRALTRLNNDLRENQSVKNMSAQRSSLLHCALSFFKDHQYTLRSTVRSLPVHPWLLSRSRYVSCPHVNDGLPVAVHFPLDGYSLHAVLQMPQSMFIPSDSSLLEVESSVLLHSQQLTGPKLDQPKSKKRSAKSLSVEPLRPPLWYSQSVREQEILIEILEHGNDVLGELSISLSESLLEDLYCVLRVLRVFLETKPISFFVHSNVIVGGRRCAGVFGTLSRFCQKLYSQCPITPSELDIGVANSTDQPSTVQSNSRGDCPHLSFPAPPPPGSTKQEFRRWRKRLVKLQNRRRRFLDSSTVPAENQGKCSMQSETNAVSTESATQNEVSPTEFSRESLPSGHTAHRAMMHSHSAALHRVNQALLDLFTLLELYGQLSPPVLVKPDSTAQSSCWPPPEEFLQRLTSYLLNDLFPVNSVWPLAINLSWLRVFDFYLMSPVRYQQRFRLITPSQRLLISPLITIFGRLMHGYSKLREQWNSSGHCVPLTRNQHRLYARVAGLLTATLSMELLQIRQTLQEREEIRDGNAGSNAGLDANSNPDANSGASANTDTGANADTSPKALPFVDVDADSSETELDSEGQCMSQALVDRFHLSSSSVIVVYETLVTLLLHLFRDEPPRIVYVPPLSECTRRALVDQLEQSQTKPIEPSVPVHPIDDTWAQCLVRLYHCRFAPVIHLRESDQTLWNQIIEAEKRMDRCDRLSVLVSQYGFTIPIEAGEHLGRMVSGYLPSLDGRYSSPYFWQATRDII